MRGLVATGVALALLVAPVSASATGPVTVKTSVSPAWLYFADRSTAQVDVVIDRRRVNPSSIRVETSFGQWDQLEPTQISSIRNGDTVHRTWRYALSCTKFACVPKGTRIQTFNLPPVVVTFQRADGSVQQIRRAWPGFNVAGRFPPPATTRVTPAFKLESTVPAASYRFQPSLLALVLDVVGVLVLAVALALVVFECLSWWKRRHVSTDDRSPLERSLALVREAQTREPDDRRRAVGLLARTLPRGGVALIATASKLAWSMPEPPPTELEELAQIVEAELEESK